MHSELLFWSNVDIKENEECWHWCSISLPSGYGRFRWKGKYHSAHRFSLELKLKRRLKSGYIECALHTCDNPSCVNPNHLFLGTAKDNVHDMMRKGRANLYLKRGVLHPQVKLDENSVKIIRILHKKGNHTYKELSEIFGVSDGAINGIVNKRRWIHIGDT